MFSSPNRFVYRTGSPLHEAQALFEGLCAGKDDESLRALGATLPPGLIVCDAQRYREHHGGPVRAIPHFIDMASAAAKHGSLPLLAGMASRPDFFEHQPYMEMRESTAHEGKPLAQACAREAAARGRVDMLAMLAAAESLFKAARHAGDRRLNRTQEWSRFQPGLSNLGTEQAKDLLEFAAYSSTCSDEQVCAVAHWVGASCRSSRGNDGSSSPISPSDFAALWLDVACESGKPSAILDALSLGASPEPRHVALAADRGAVQAAKAMALLAQSPVVRPGRRHSILRDESKDPVAESMARSFEHAFDSIACGILEWRSPSELSREATWAEFSDHREVFHANALMALRGDFDTAADEPSGLDAAKARLASAARAMAALDPKDPCARVAEIDAVRLGSAPLSPELILLARVGSPRFATALDQASIAEASEACRKLCLKHAEASKAAPGPDPSNRSAGGHDSAARQLDLLRVALYELYSRESSKLGTSTRQLLAEELSARGLSREFERRVLDQASGPASKRRGPLRA